MRTPVPETSLARRALTAGEIAALDNLARKRAGVEVGWIQISAAQALTALGLATRGGGGWTITAEGLTALADEPSPPPPEPPAPQRLRTVFTRAHDPIPFS